MGPGQKTTQEEKARGGFIRHSRAPRARNLKCAEASRINNFFRRMETSRIKDQASHSQHRFFSTEKSQKT